jgi:hypothetical protein
MTQIDTTVSSSAPSKRVVSPRARIRPVAAEPAKPAPAERPRKRRSALVKKTDVARVVSAVARAGFVAGSIEVTKDGTIRIYAVGAEPTVSLFDQWADKL